MAVIKEDKGDASTGMQTEYTLSLGDVFQGTLQAAGDKDWLKVELSAETIYDFTLTGIEGEAAALTLFDAAGNRVVSGNYTPVGTKLIFSPSVSGIYYIEAGSGDDSVAGSYELALVENTIPVGNYDEIAEYLTDGFWEWTGGARSAFHIGSGATLTANITALTEAGQQLARWAFEAWTNVTEIKFEFVEHNHADIVFSNKPDITATGGPTAIRSGLIIASEVNIPPDYVLKHGTTIGSYSFSTFIHEIGHALGLGHPGPYPEDHDNPVAYYGVEPVFLIDSEQVTLMSQSENTYLDASFSIPVAPMIVDIIAIQNLYGVPDGINTGDTIYGYRSNVDGYLGEFFRLWSGEANPFSSIQTPGNDDTPTIKPALVDLDGDGDPDLVIGNNTGSLHYFENTGTAANPDFTGRADAENPLKNVSVWSYSAPTFTDLDGDGDLDIVVGDGNDAIAYFENTGVVTSARFTQRVDADNPFINISMGSWSTLAFADLDGDGDSDLAVGTNEGDVPYYENIGTEMKPEFTLRTGASSPLDGINTGSNNSPVFIDVGNDDDYDLVIGNRNGSILYFENIGTTTQPDFIQRTDFDNPFQGIDAGYFIGLEFTDLNGDDNPDLITGNLSGAITYYENTGTLEAPQFSPQSLTRPTTFTLYDNGGIDTLDVRTDSADQRIYLGPQGISDVYGLVGNVIIARDTWIENAVAGSGDDVLAGNAVANDLRGRDGNDRIWGSGGDDILEGGAGADRLNGGAGLDWAAYRDSDAAVTINLTEGIVQGGHAEGDVLIEIENLIGSAHDDVLVGDDAANRLEGGGGADRLDGGAGEDWASYQWSDGGVRVDLAEGTGVGGDAQGDVITNVENLAGSGFNDVLRGDDNVNRIEGGGGSDRLWGVGGDDVLAGGEGDDWLVGSVGGDQLDGGAGLDGLSYELSAAGVTVDLEEGTSTGGYAQGDVIVDIEHVMGSAYQDTLTGDSGGNELYGLGDDDVLLGSGGDDSLEGGAGADRLEGGDGLDWTVYLTSDAGVTINLADNTAAGGHAGGDTLKGIENITGSEYQDVLTGDSGPNKLHGAGANDDLRGQGGVDSLYGGAGDDALRGGAGNDTLEGGLGADRLDGGSGADWLSYLRSDAGVVVSLRDNTVAGGHAEGDVIAGFESIAGSAHPDVLTGDDNANELAGDAGDDELYGGSGDDVLQGGVGADKMDGGTGVDALSYRLSPSGVQVNLAMVTAVGGHAEGDTFTAIENITGTVYRDVLTGDDEANRLDGAGGDDTLQGLAGADQLIGNAGADDLYGGEGNDELRGSAGHDQLFGESGADVMHGDEDDDQLYGGADRDQLFGGAGSDSLYGNEGDDALQGGDGNDHLYGNTGADRLDGGGGMDWASYLGSSAGVRVNLMAGTAGGGEAEGDMLIAIENLIGSGYADMLRGDGLANVLYGLEGADELYGNGGDDVLQGGAGADRLDGGSGIDTLSYQGSDEGVAVDFSRDTSEGGHAEGDVITNVENITGSDYDDYLIGDDGANRLVGGEGDDSLIGRGGKDYLDGGPGRDWLNYSTSDAGIVVDLVTGTAENGHAEGDVIIDLENILGSRYPDVLVGNDDYNYLDGFEGDDEMTG
ncbi:MAG: FG-GAP-like repeat-containing protein [Gammaproteobacteria bacterium]|nr:FG-GAP-like repeat-containing protein [Gammaproteobacteria bacterium]